MPATLSINFTNQAEVEGANPPANKSVSAKVLADVLGGGGVAGGYVTLAGSQTITGTKTFSSTIVGSINGNAATVTNGVYTSGNQTIGGTKTFSSTIAGSINGNAATASLVTNGVYTIGDQTIGGTKTFSGDVRVDSFGVGTAASGTSGEIRATNNITAYYSDGRLKDFLGKIPQALEKVQALNGYYFKENEKAKSLGYDNDKIQVGVNAQEVENVLPEIVTLAPIDIEIDESGKEISKSGENLKTVYYDKLVPLLIEAIKELNDKVKNLEAKLNS